MAEGQISPWWPEQDRLRLAVLGKLIEELNEMSARAARCIIHGLDEADPDTGRLNRDELAREAADVRACLHILAIVLGVDADEDRVMAKVAGFGRWHQFIRAGAPADAVLAGARKLLAAVDFDNNGSVVGQARVGGNGGLISMDTTRAADELRQALEGIAPEAGHG